MTEAPTILLIENDEATTCKLRAALNHACDGCTLNRKGCSKVIRMERCRTLAEGLGVLEQLKINVIVADLHLPDAEGVQVIVKLQELYPDLAVVALSVQAEEAMGIDAVAAGAQDYLHSDDLEHFNLMMKIYQAVERQNLRNEMRLARERAKQQAEFKSKFLAHMSHEIRTPMNGVLGLTSLLLDDPRVAEEHRHMLSGIRVSGESLLSIINDILDVSKIEAGKLKLEVVSFNVRELVESCLETFAEGARKKRLTLTNLIDAKVPRFVQADSNRIRQVVSNLISNAIKFTDQGSICVAVSVDSVENKLRFDVRDTGIGVPKDKQDLLFKPYSQANFEDQFVGTGLGLSICKNLCQIMRGDVGLDSAPGKGSNFWFTVAYKEDAEVARTRERAVLDRRSVLVLSGNPGNALWIERQLTARGLLAEVTTSVEATLARIDVAMPELVVIDANSYHSQALGAAYAAILKRLAGRPALVVNCSDGGVSDGLQHAIMTPTKQSELYQVIAKLIGGESYAALAGTPRGDVPATFAYAGLNALVVDDGEINRRVATKMLAVLGIAFETAVDGAEAVARCAETKFDLIFMDCRMPEMSGFEATSRIRRGGGGNATTPIIALTANAFTEDRERCAVAGMDDFLAKPIDVATLRVVVDKWRGRRTPADAVATVAVESNDDPVLDVAALLALKELNDPRDAKSFLDDLIDTFCSESGQVVDALALALAGNDARSIEHHAHKLKGFARNLGARRLARTCGDIEKSAFALAESARREGALAIKSEYVCAKNELTSTWRGRAA